MGEELSKDIEEKIKEEKKLSIEKSQERNKQIFRNLLFAIFVMIYFLALNLGYYTIEKSVFVKDTAIFSMISLIIAIILFEKAFNGDKGYLAIHGIEVLSFSIFTYFMPYTYFTLGEIVNKICMFMPTAIVAYYCLKSLAIWIRLTRKSDVKEIVKKEEKNNDDLAANMDKDKEAELEEEKTNAKMTKKMKEETKKKKDTKPKKETEAKEKPKKKDETKNKQENKKKNETKDNYETKSKKVSKIKEKTKITVDKKEETNEKLKNEAETESKVTKSKRGRKKKEETK